MPRAPLARASSLEPYRWAELEQLVFSRHAGSAVWSGARSPRSLTSTVVAAATRVVEHGLGLIGELIGDDEADVQKALSWALRSLVVVDLPAVDDVLRA